MQWNKEFREQVRLFRKGMHSPMLGEFEQANGERMLFVVERDNTLVVCEKDGCIVEGLDVRVCTSTYSPTLLEGNKRKKLSLFEMYEKKKVLEEKKEKKRQERERDRWIPNRKS